MRLFDFEIRVENYIFFEALPSSSMYLYLSTRFELVSLRKMLAMLFSFLPLSLPVQLFYYLSSQFLVAFRVAQ